MPGLSAALVRVLPCGLPGFPIVFTVLAVALLAGVPAGASPLVALEGTLHERESFSGLVPENPSTSLLPDPLPSGGFSFYAGADLRTDPQAAVLETDAGGWLVALAPPSLRRLHPPRRDPESGRTLRPDAPDGADCTTGDEPDCWRPGDPPLAVEDVVDALCAAVGAELSSCRFRDGLEHAPLAIVPFRETGVLPAAREPTGGLELRGIETTVLPPSLEGIPLPPFPDLGAPTAFPSELSATSFNFLLLLAASSGNGGDGSPSDSTPNPPGAFDPDDPFATGAGQCSFLQLQFCSAVQAFFSAEEARLRALPDDPFGTPHERWIWEAGAELEISAAGGALGHFAGGKLFALGPERARVGNLETDVGVTFLLVSDDPAETPQLFFAAPEPEGGALAGAAIATLAAVSRRRRARS